ncbi:MAG TPA: efflux RND transporter periplasmic adaptor subunit [Candidatus Acidoferrales bacterium]|nr:efflux RND transporter periplasmic adaptor subunit [Candidatus Acidoferrales bacterium]
MRLLRTPILRIAALAVAVIVVAAGVLWYRSRTAATPAPAASAAALPPPTVGVVPVGRRDLTRSISIVAELRPWNVVNLYAKQTGYLQTISVDYGSKVSAGETIATLELPEQEATYQQDEAAYRLAKVDYDRILSVEHQEPGLIAQEDVDKAQATYEEAKDQRDQAAVLLDYANIIAPFSGVVTKRYADPGALIQAGTSSGTTPIVQIADNYVLRLVVEVPEDIVEAIHVGTPVGVKIQSTGQTLRGRVARFSYDVHQDTRTMHTEIDIDNPDLSLKPGMYAQASIVLASRPDVIAVPTQAVSEIDGGANVWVVDGADRIQQRNVTTGLQTSEWVEIRSGLNVGDRVVFGDRSAFNVGQKVQPKFVRPVLTAA